MPQTSSHYAVHWLREMTVWRNLTGGFLSQPHLLRESGLYNMTPDLLLNGLLSREYWVT